MNELAAIRSVSASTAGAAKSASPPPPVARSGTDGGKGSASSVELLGTPSQGDSAPQAISPAQVEAAVAELNVQFQLANRSLRFQVDEESELLVVKVIDDDTGETIRQIPSEVTVHLAAYRENVSGLLTNVKG